MNTRTQAKTSHEFKVVLSLSLCFGLVGLDRFVINPLFPVIANDLSLKYSDIGLVSAIVALAWGVASVVMGRQTDRVGCKAVLIPSLLAFSVLAGLCGATTDLASLLTVRGLMGLAEGTFVPACIVATTYASSPRRQGQNVGLLHVAAALFGLALPPLLVPPLLTMLPSWHWVFALAAIPGLLMAYVIHRVLPSSPSAAAMAPPPPPAMAGRSVLRRPIIANALAMSCWLATLTTLGALLPSYLTDHLGLSLDQMGKVLAGQGLGGMVGMVIVPMLGDRFGYRRVALLAGLVAIGALTLLTQAPAATGELFAVLFLAGFAGSGLMALTVGPLTGQAVTLSLATAATGLVVGCGEIVGGALAPALAGWLATMHGIDVIPPFALVVTTLGLLALALNGGANPKTVAMNDGAKPI